MKPRTPLISIAAMALLGACNVDTSNNSSGDGQIPVTAAAANSAVSSNSVATDEGDDRGGHETGEPTLLLAADGIMAGGTPESRIPFGANSLDTIERVTPLLGATFERNEGNECGAGPMEFANWGKVVLAFSQGEFVGWELREASENPWTGTPGGATIGTLRAELEAAFGTSLTVQRTSLGIEFNAAGFTGLLSSEAANGRVTALWAGTNCAMR